MIPQEGNPGPYVETAGRRAETAESSQAQSSHADLGYDSVFDQPTDWCLRLGLGGSFWLEKIEISQWGQIEYTKEDMMFQYTARVLVLQQRSRKPADCKNFSISKA